MRKMLADLGYENVWLKDSANFLSNSREPILEKLRQELGVEDIKRVQKSTSIPHYQNIVNGTKAEAYLSRNFPFYLVTCIAQCSNPFDTFTINSALM